MLGKWWARPKGPKRQWRSNERIARYKVEGTEWAACRVQTLFTYFEYRDDQNLKISHISPHDS